MQRQRAALTALRAWAGACCGGCGAEAGGLVGVGTSGQVRGAPRGARRRRSWPGSCRDAVAPAAQAWQALRGGGCGGAAASRGAASRAAAAGAAGAGAWRGFAARLHSTLAAEAGSGAKAAAGAGAAAAGGAAAAVSGVRAACGRERGGVRAGPAGAQQALGDVAAGGARPLQPADAILRHCCPPLPPSHPRPHQAAGPPGAALSAGIPDATRRRLAWWLGGCTAWVASMVVIGGVTRLTRSGLSMTDWKFTGGCGV
jgi:hypothetical protein